MADEQFLDYCNQFHVGIIGALNTVDGTNKPGSGWYIQLKVPL